MFTNSDKLQDALHRRFANCRVLVVGDLMLDRHVHGEVNRISPEGPVPVVRVTATLTAPGGAGNVAMNLARLGVQTAVAGVVGDDAAAGALRAQLHAAGVDTAAVITLPARPTCTKTRVISGHQQLLRLDEETAEPLAVAPAALLAEIDALFTKLSLSSNATPGMYWPRLRISRCSSVM